MPFFSAMLNDTPSIHIFLKNLHALSATGQDELVKRLESPTGGAPVEIIKDPYGKINARFIGWHNPWIHDYQSPHKIQELIKAEHSSLLLLGTGLGFELDVILSKSVPSVKIFAYERYPDLLKIALSMRDYSREILSKNLVFLIGSDLATYPWHQEPLPYLVPHPVLGTIYKEEQLWWKQRLVGVQKHITCFVNLNGLLTRDILDELLTMGINAYPIDIVSLSPSEIISQIRNLSPHFFMTINYVKGLPKICASLDVPLVVWEVDPRIEMLPDDEISHRAIQNMTHIYVYRRKLVTHYQEMGFHYVRYLPLAANTRKYCPMNIEPDLHKKYEADISFVGNSMQSQGDWLMRKAVSLLKKFSSQPNIEEAVHKIVNIQCDCPDKFILPELVGSMLTQLNRPFIIDEGGRKISIVGCLSEKPASERRIMAVNALAELAKEKIVKVWGDPGWQNRLASSIIYAGPAGHFHELPIIYNASRINLDVNRLYQKDIVPLRIFDILACNAFVLADDSQELNSLFQKGEEIVSFKKISQIPSICAYYLKHEDERKEIARRGYEKVLKEHTLRQRLSFILDDLKLG